MRDEFFHDGDAILTFPLCQQPFMKEKRIVTIPGNTARRDKRVPNPKARLREQIHEVIQFHHYSSRTRQGQLPVLAEHQAYELFGLLVDRADC